MKKRRVKCKNAAKYKGETNPNCGDDKYFVCDTCVATWQKAQAERIKRANAPNTNKEKVK